MPSERRPCDHIHKPTNEDARPRATTTTSVISGTIRHVRPKAAAYPPGLGEGAHSPRPSRHSGNIGGAT